MSQLQPSPTGQATEVARRKASAMQTADQKNVKEPAKWGRWLGHLGLAQHLGPAHMKDRTVFPMTGRCMIQGRKGLFARTSSILQENTWWMHKVHLQVSKADQKGREARLRSHLELKYPNLLSILFSHYRQTINWDSCSFFCFCWLTKAVKSKPPLKRKSTEEWGNRQMQDGARHCINNRWC